MGTASLGLASLPSADELEEMESPSRTGDELALLILSLRARGLFFFLRLNIGECGAHLTVLVGEVGLGVSSSE